jgi:hypothetical protein
MAMNRSLRKQFVWTTIAIWILCDEPTGRFSCSIALIIFNCLSADRDVLLSHNFTIGPANLFAICPHFGAGGEENIEKTLERMLQQWHCRAIE